VLDTRGAIGVTERANYFHRMRTAARRIAELYLEQRQRLEYPFMEAWPEKMGVQEELAIQFTQMARPHTFLLEIGVEELPVSDLESAQRQLNTAVPELLRSLRLNYNRVELFGAPRRLAVMVHGLMGRQDDLETVVKGPPAARAFDKEGNPTQAAIGFARGKGVDAADLQVVEDGKKRYVTAVVREDGKPAAHVLAETLPALIGGLKFEKSMRWNQSNVAFSRPVRWIVALYGPDVIHFEFAGVESGRKSRGLRPLGSPSLEIDDAANYPVIMRKHGIVIQSQRRRELIKSVSAKLAAEKGGVIPDDPDLLAEVTNLVERPTPLRGQFEKRFLKLPAEALVAVMRKHQRYFPVYDKNGQLLPYFIAVRNGDEKHLDVVIDGNEHVIRARFADAEFFYNKDVKRPLPDFLPDLERLTFQADLGSMLDKVKRLEQLTPIVAGMLGLSDEETAVAARAAALSKADLATSMVVEMTSLQGIMGGHYAQLNGESSEAAAAIAEQYSAVSQTKPGLALALADRLDSLAGLFAAGLAPKGSNDPFGLRRAALHLIENLTQNEISLDVRAGLRAAGDLLPVSFTEETLAQALGFVYGRLEAALREQGFAASVVKAVLAEQAHNPYAARQTAVSLTAAVAEPDWEPLLDAYARCVRITRNLDEAFDLRPDAFALAAEQELLAAYQKAASANDGALPAFVDSLRAMAPTINQFFNAVLVMAEETAVRQNRLALLQHIANLTKDIADLSQLEGF